MKFSDGTKFIEVYDEAGNIVVSGSISAVAKTLGVGRHTIHLSINEGKLIKKKYEACEVGVMRKVYDAYKNGKLVGCGTAQELARVLGEKEYYIKWLSYPTAEKRICSRKKESGQLAVFLHEEPRIDYFCYLTHADG